MTDLSTLSNADLQALYAKSAAAKSVSQMSDDELKAAYEQPSTVKDVAKSAGVGVAKGGIGLAGLVGDVQSGMRSAGDWVGDKLGLPRLSPEQDAKLRGADAPTSSSIRKKVEGVTGEFYKPQTTAGKYAETVGEFVPAGLAMGPGGLVRKAITNVALPGVASEAAGQATEGTKAEPFARVAAAMAGGIAPSVAARAVTPLPARPAHQRLVDILNQEGVTSLTAGQRTGNEALRYAESSFGNAPFAGGQTNRITRQGQEQFTEAATSRAGTGPSATPDTLAANQRRLGNEFDQLSARNTLQMDPQFATDISQVIRDYGRVLPSEQRERVFNILTDLGQHGNALPGTVYQATRSRLSRVANNNRMSDPDFADAMRGIRNALDSAMGRSIAPADQAAWRAARQEYGAQKVIEKAASRAGEATAEGQIVPANLRNTVAAENRGAYARGEGPFSELARAGAGVMAPMPQSGTAPRSMIYHLMNWGSAGAAPAALGRTLMSRPVQGYLGNQLLANTQLDLRRAAVINAMIAAQQQSAGE